VIETNRPIISFTFDDFPRSAMLVGGAILKQFGVCGTYYVAFGLLGQETPTGRIAESSDLPSLVEHGHELGCHTLWHCDAWKTGPRTFEESIVGNRITLGRLLPSTEFRTFSYPKSPPSPRTKRIASRYFECSRAGGQSPNVGNVDLNQLSAYFLEKSRGRIHDVKDVVDLNRQARGWLVFATHDIEERPSPFGCTPEFFEDVVKYAVKSGACVLPVAAALDQLGISHVAYRQQGSGLGEGTGMAG
jgi:peptidoglycan/xylan/chitin deacetylase (PgdA/CDA1 family)